MTKKQPVYLCEVVIRNRFYGRRFMLRSTKDIVAFGLQPASVKAKSRQADDNVLFGIRITLACTQPYIDKAISEGYTDEWQDISDAYIKHPARFRTRSKPIVGQIVKGKHKGERVALFALTDVSVYFPVESVRKAIIDKNIYRGIAWHYAKDYDEAEKYYQGESIQNDILLSLCQEKRPSRGWLVEGCRYTIGYQTIVAYLTQAEKAILSGDTMDGLVLLHKALGEYQTLFKYKMNKDETIHDRFEQLSCTLSPKAQQCATERVNATEVKSLIRLLIRQLKRKK